VSAREELLAAARRLRETAAAATPGPWEDCSDPDGGAWPRYVVGSVRDEDPQSTEVLRVHESVDEHVVTREDTAWIALASPALAGPLADWLEHEAGRDHTVRIKAARSPYSCCVLRCSCGATQPDPDAPMECPRLGNALAVARAINGEVAR